MGEKKSFGTLDGIREARERARKRYRIDTESGGSVYVTRGDTVRFTQKMRDGDEIVPGKEMTAYISGLEFDGKGYATTLTLDFEKGVFKLVRLAFPVFPVIGGKATVSGKSFYWLTIDEYNPDVAINAIADGAA